MKQYTVDYKAGESRWNPSKSVDYMMVIADNLDIYAETESEDDEAATYDDLKTDILEQAAENGVAAESLVFCYDEERKINE